VTAVFTSSESVLAFHREAIEQAFGAPVRDRYGTTEFAVSMTGCDASHLHVDSEFCVVEVEPVEETEAYVRGPLLVTGLSNYATCFLRYRIGDTGTKLKTPCPCGRPGDVFEAIEGRNDDYVVTPDGRRIGRLDHIFKGLRDIAEAQILQDHEQAVTFLIVPRPSYDGASRKKLIKEIRARLGDQIEVEIRLVGRIERGPGGKFRAVISKVGKRSDSGERSR
jgi:phenylacetate-CoA ligase